MKTFAVPAASGDGRLQSRNQPPGEAGTAGVGLYAYEYRVDLTQVGALTAQICVDELRVDFGPVESLDYGVLQATTGRRPSGNRHVEGAVGTDAHFATAGGAAGRCVRRRLGRLDVDRDVATGSESEVGGNRSRHGGGEIKVNPSEAFQTVGRGGATIELPADSPRNATAAGSVWLVPMKGRTGERRLSIDLTLPERANQPATELEISFPVSVGGQGTP